LKFSDSLTLSSLDPARLTLIRGDYNTSLQDSIASQAFIDSYSPTLRIDLSQRLMQWLNMTPCVEPLFIAIDEGAMLFQTEVSPLAFGVFPVTYFRTFNSPWFV
jgi:hypothetical protein